MVLVVSTSMVPSSSLGRRIMPKPSFMQSETNVLMLPLLCAGPTSRPHG